MNVDERRFYGKIRPVASKMELRISRIENEIEAGWPDVLVRGEGDVHIWLELKVTRGSRFKIKVRPEQINWAEDHYSHGGRVWLLAMNRFDSNQFFVVEAPEIRRVAEEGCLGLPCYPIRQLPNLLFSWQGIYVDLQSENPTSAEKRSALDFTPKRVTIAGAVLSRLRADGIHDPGHDRRPHNSSGARGRSRGLESPAPLQDMPRRQERKGETRTARQSTVRRA